MKNTNLFIFTYDYPYVGNDSKFIIDEINFLSKLFNKVYLIPIKVTNKKIKQNKNVIIDHKLINEIYNLKHLLIKLSKIITCKYFWRELTEISYNNFFRKIKMIIKERYLAESIFYYVKRKKIKLKGNFFYSIWSNHTLMGFNLLKENRLINYCFARSLGQDVSGFIPNDDYVAYLKPKFKNLDFVLVLNNGQIKKLLSNQIIKKNKIIKNFMGMKKSLGNKLNFEKDLLNFASCGSLNNVKNTLEIFKFIQVFSKNHPEVKVNYFCIGDGVEKENLMLFAKDKFKLDNLNFIYINKIPNLVNFLKRKKINYFLNFSKIEGMSFAVMEAISCYIPIICSKIEGNKEIMNGKNGYVIKKYDLKEYLSLSKKIKKNFTKKNYVSQVNNSKKIFFEKIERNKNLRKFYKILKLRLLY